MDSDQKILVAYFSCTGVTKKAAQALARIAGADLYEIKPAIPYTPADLNWRDDKARSTVEMKDKTSRPRIAGEVHNMDDYAVVLLGFPIWWYIAPTIINTFLESHDLSGKIIVPFATSGGSDFGATMSYLKPSCPDTVTWREGQMLNGFWSEAELAQWIETAAARR